MSATPQRALDEAVVLASGGLDSSVCLALARRCGGGVLALGFDYGQRNRIELERLRAVAAQLGCGVLIVPIDMGLWFQGGLVGHGLPEASETVTNYVPARNLVFLSVAASVAEREAQSCFISAPQPPTAIIPIVRRHFSARSAPLWLRGSLDHPRCEPR